MSLFLCMDPITQEDSNYQQFDEAQLVQRSDLQTLQNRPRNSKPPPQTVAKPISAEFSTHDWINPWLLA